MAVKFKVKTRFIPAELEDKFGSERIDKLLTMIEEGKNVNEIIKDGGFSRNEASVIIAELSKAGILTMASGKEPAKGTPSKASKKQADSEIVLITDSTADIPKQVAEEKNIQMIPLSIQIGEKTFLDGVTISASEFYYLLRTSREFPATSPPTEADFHRLFMKYIGEKDILGIFISRKMSKTFERATAAKMNNYNAYLKERTKENKSTNFRIEIIDSQLVSMGAGLLVMETADRIQQGATMDEALAFIHEMIPKMRVFLIANTLKYLVRGGRIGKAKGTIGTIFRFRPILGLSDGVLSDRAKVIGGKRAQLKLLDIIKKDLGDPHRPIHMAITHADALDWAEQMQELVTTNLNCRTLIVTDFGPTVGSHTGPGTVGVAYYPVAEAQ